VAAKASDRQQEASGKRPAGEVAIGRHIRLRTTQPMPQFDRKTAKAYGAFDKRSPSTPMYALVCDESAPPRLNILATLSRIENMPIVVPVDWGVVDWLDTGERRFAVAFEAPVGERIVADPEGSFRPWRDEKIVEQVIAPAVRVLTELDSRGVTHRGICLENIYTGSSGAVLGEFVGVPAGFIQPAVYETIQAGQAAPEGRGEGTGADDLYALGVVIVMLLRGGNRMAGWSDEAVVAEKIANGSYFALLGRTSVSLKLMEPLRGLLCDIEAERWKIQDLEMWLNGRQLSPMQATLPTKARRPFAFDGVEYISPQALAHAMANRWPAALQLMRQGDMDLWAQRNLPNETQANRIRGLLVGGQTGQGGGEDRALARLLMALDPAAPIRMRNLAARPRALAKVLALNYDKSNGIRDLVIHAILAKLPQRWIEFQLEGTPDPQEIQTFERMGFFLGRNQPGYGVERFIYEFNDDWPCLSPLVRGQFVHTIEALLPALERLAQSGDTRSEPVDRHIIAFCAARMYPQPERLLQGLADARDSITRQRAILHLLAQLQRRHGPAKLPALTRWVGEFANPVVESLRNQKLKDRARKALERAVEQGSLVEMVAGVDDPEARRRDVSGFEIAQKEYERITREIDWLENGGLTAAPRIAQASASASAAVSGLCSGLILMFLTLFYVL
jgi:hypothetical protein